MCHGRANGSYPHHWAICTMEWWYMLSPYVYTNNYSSWEEPAWTWKNCISFIFKVVLWHYGLSVPFSSYFFPRFQIPTVMDLVHAISPGPSETGCRHGYDLRVWQIPPTSRSPSRKAPHKTLFSWHNHKLPQKIFPTDNKFFMTKDQTLPITKSSPCRYIQHLSAIPHLIHTSCILIILFFS